MEAETGEREIWPVLIEKAYAKMHGNFKNIVGGVVSRTLAELTNGIPETFLHASKDIKQEFNTGEYWSRVVKYKEEGYLLGAGSPGSDDSQKSDLGIVLGHAYSVLDVAEIDGNQLILLRNPWGGSEWQGPWGDNSKEWNEKRKRIAYERMKEQGVEQTVIGKEDGVFWMSFTDFFRYFDSLYTCRLFSPDSWGTIFVDSEWNKESQMAGGNRGSRSFHENPQFSFQVEATSADNKIECYMELTITSPKKEGVDTPCMGFHIYNLGGDKVEANTKRSDSSLICKHGSLYLRTWFGVDTEERLPANRKPYTLVISTH